MVVSRNFYFHGLRAYDLTATQRLFHRKFEEEGNPAAERLYHEIMSLFSDMRYTVNVDDNTLWPDPFHCSTEGVYLPDGSYEECLRYPHVPTFAWFAANGVEAAVPEIDLSDVTMVQFLDDQQNQGRNGEHGHALHMMADIFSSPVVPYDEDELEWDDAEFWERVASQLED